MHVPRVKISGFVVIAIGTVALLAGCAVDTGSEVDVRGNFDVRVSEALDEARSEGASEAQLAVVEQAGKDGRVSFEDAKVAASSAVSCMGAVGITATYQEDALPNGLVIPGFTVKAPEDPALLEAADRCEFSESYWVNKLYQTQPSAIDANLAYIDRQAPVIRQCLEDNGYDTDPDATGLELVVQSGEIARQTGGKLDCALDAGVMGY